MLLVVSLGKIIEIGRFICFLGIFNIASVSLIISCRMMRCGILGTMSKEIFL
jgi:hypothetical protein